MTDSLVTRLRALACNSYRFTQDEPEGLALLEAADALETATIQRRVANLNNEGNLARAKKAEAEVAALQSRLNEANADRDHLEHKIDQLEARVKKLEAVAEALFSLDREMKQQHGQFMHRAASVAPRLWETVGDALAALDGG